MIERAIRGSRRYHAWLALLCLLSSLALVLFIAQYELGLGITAMGRDVTWGFYIAQLTFLVGVAASAVMVVLPYYLHDYKAFGRITILGEFLAIPAVLLCPLFVAVDLGQPFRFANLFLHPSPTSPMFWDTVVLLGYLLLNLVIGWTTLDAERNGAPPPRWVKPLIYLSIPWAVSIHTVTAFLYAGLAARPFWATAVMAPRFLASAFAAGPALLIILCLIVRRVSNYDPGERGIHKLAQIVTYAMAINIFLLLMEVFTAFYSGIPHHAEHFEYLFWGLHGHVSSVAPFMWLSMLLAAASMVLLIVPRFRTNLRILVPTCVMVFVSIWLDKGAGLMTGGMIPSPRGTISPYFPSLVEILMGVGLYAFGALVLTLLYKVAISVKEDTA
jgi:Ni/Fe-hydrogenase subunit HybB-like protein